MTRRNQQKANKAVVLHEKTLGATMAQIVQRDGAYEVQVWKRQVVIYPISSLETALSNCKLVLEHEETMAKRGAKRKKNETMTGAQETVKKALQIFKP